MEENSIGLKQRFMHEMRLFFFYFIFFALFLIAFTTYTRLIYAANDIPYIHYEYDIIEALILAKIILLGEHFRFGERFADRALIIPTLYKTLIFSLFVLVFTFAEHFIIGFFEGHNFAKLYEEFIDKNLYATLAKLLIMLFVFILFFAFMEINRVLGERKLYNLFFCRNDSTSQH